MSAPVLGFIGVGELALYTIRGLRHGGYSGKILLSPRNRDKAAWLAQHLDCDVLADNQSVVERSNLVVIATRPAQCLETLSSLDFRPEQILISVVAGMPSAEIASVLNQSIEIVRAMPVSSAEFSASPTLIFPKNNAVADLFKHCGDVIPVNDESAFEQGSVHACVYTWFFALFEELIQATESAALPREMAGKLVMGMARGAAELALAKPDSTPGDIGNDIATDGTYSRLGLDLLEENEAFAPWHSACNLLKQKLDPD